MPAAAPRIDARLLAALCHLDDPARPIADTNRQLGETAHRLGLPRPSYETVRALVHVHRQGRLHTPVGEVLLDIAFRARPPDALLDALAGIQPPRQNNK